MSLGTYIRASGGVRTRNSSKRAATNQRLRPVATGTGYYEYLRETNRTAAVQSRGTQLAFFLRAFFMTLNV